MPENQTIMGWEKNKNLLGLLSWLITYPLGTLNVF